MKPKFDFLPKKHRKNKLVKNLEKKLNKMKEKIVKLTLEQAFLALEGQDLIESAHVLKESFSLTSQQLYDEGRKFGYF